MNTHSHSNERTSTIRLLLVSTLALGAGHNDLVELRAASENAQAVIIQNEMPLMLSKAAFEAAFFMSLIFIKNIKFVEYLALIR